MTFANQIKLLFRSKFDQNATSNIGFKKESWCHNYGAEDNIGKRDNLNGFQTFFKQNSKIMPLLILFILHNHFQISVFFISWAKLIQRRLGRQHKELNRLKRMELNRRKHMELNTLKHMEQSRPKERTVPNCRGMCVHKQLKAVLERLMEHYKRQRRLVWLLVRRQPKRKRQLNRSE